MVVVEDDDDRRKDTTIQRLFAVESSNVATLRSPRPRTDHGWQEPSGCYLCHAPAEWPNDVLQAADHQRCARPCMPCAHVGLIRIVARLRGIKATCSRVQDSCADWACSPSRQQQSSTLAGLAAPQLKQSTGSAAIERRAREDRNKSGRH